MASPSDKRITTIRYLNSRANPLPSNDVPPANSNHSTSRNTQDSSAPKDETTTKSRTKRRHSDTEGNRRTPGSADRKYLASARPGVRYDTRKAEPSSLNDLHPSSPHAPTVITAGKDGATGKLKGKRRHSDVDGAEDISTSELRRQNLQTSTKPGLRSTSPVIKKESPWWIYDGGYDLRVGGRVTVAKKNSPVSQVAEVVAIRQLSGSSRNDSLSTLFQVQGEYFVKCTEAYESEADLYIVLEHMPISLVQVVAAPVHPRETRVAAIVGQVLSGIQFLESKNMVHGNITCSTVLLNNNGQVKIGMQECCTAGTQEPANVDMHTTATEQPSLPSIQWQWQDESVSVGEYQELKAK